MTIYIDFDQTVNSKAFPHFGPPIPGSIETIKRLIVNGHKIVLNTARVYFGQQQMTDTINYFKKYDIIFDKILAEKEIPQPYYNVKKIADLNTNPLFKPEVSIYIDDIAPGIPTYIFEGTICVDWKAIVSDFENIGIFK